MNIPKNMLKHTKFAWKVEKKIFGEFLNDFSLLRPFLGFLCIAFCRTISRSHFFIHFFGVGGEDEAYALVEFTSWSPPKWCRIHLRHFQVVGCHGIFFLSLKLFLFSAHSPWSCTLSFEIKVCLFSIEGAFSHDTFVVTEFLVFLARIFLSDKSLHFVLGNCVCVCMCL